MGIWPRQSVRRRDLSSEAVAPVAQGKPIFWRLSDASGSQRELAYGPGEPALLTVGEVRMVEEEANPYVIS